MIKTTEIAPHPALAPFVRCYTYREFNTCGQRIIKPWHAVQQISMPFFFRAVPVKLTEPSSGKILKTGKPTGIVGLSRQYNGDMHFEGDYHFFEILFRPGGLYGIFDIVSREVIDRIQWGDEVFKNDHLLLHEQMFRKTPHQMAELANSWLLKYHSRRRRTASADRMDYCCDAITKQNGLIRLDQLAKDANMSIRSFERHFEDLIGLSPKQLCCITRFNYALEMKLSHPAWDWTAIAQYAGYYDQMHLIKDFKRFSGDAPSSLLRHTPMFLEDYDRRIAG